MCMDGDVRTSKDAFRSDASELKYARHRGLRVLDVGGKVPRSPTLNRQALVTKAIIQGSVNVFMGPNIHKTMMIARIASLTRNICEGKNLR